MPKVRTEEVTIGMINELHLKVAKGKILSKFEKLCSQILKMKYESIGTKLFRLNEWEFTAKVRTALLSLGICLPFNVYCPIYINENAYNNETLEH